MTPATVSATPALCFGAYRLDIAEARLTRDGSPVALRPKAFDLLATLAVRPNELVTKDELLDRVWGRRFITEGVIKSIVGELRSALRDDPKQPRWIETVPRRGYRFVGEIRSGGMDVAEAPDGTGNLPASRVEPIGRADALRAIALLHDAHRLVTVCGPFGVGKTCVALALAASRGARWRDGVWLVELAAVAADATDVAALCATIARTLRLAAGAGSGADALATAVRPLESLRAFALERLDEAGETQATGDQHLTAALAYWKAADDHALDTPALAWADRHGVALAWIAAHEARDDDAARIVGWHAASLASFRATSSGAYVARALCKLEALLRERLGTDAFDQVRAAGASLDDAWAERLGLGS